MPKVLIFAVCEKVILSTENTVSLITIMEAIRIGVASNTPSDIQLVARTIWYAFSLWQREEGDKDGAHYHQKVELILPDGKMALETQPIDIEFAQGRHNNHGVFQMLGFP